MADNYDNLYSCTVLDEDGSRIGTVSQVYLDDATAEPTFVAARVGFFGNKEVLVPLVGWLGDHLGPQSTVLFGVICVGLALVVITFVIMRTDQIRLRLGTGRRGWVWLERGSLTEEVDEPER